MPDARERAKLWEVLVPPKARAENIDFELLGERFEISGGYIKNCAYRACIMAASQNKKVDTDMLWDAGIYELRELGHIIRDE